MPETIYRARRAATLENGQLRLTVLREGGHIAEIFDKQTGVNPLWTPPWPSIEPSTYNAARHPEYGTGAEAKLLAGIMGHNLCLDLFGPPSPEEAAAGMTVHGEGSIVPYEISESSGQLVMHAELPVAQLRFERRLELDGRAVRIQETVENLSGCDRPIAWTQHVTLGPPFLEKGTTRFRASATRSMVGNQAFDWPMLPRPGGQGLEDLRVFTDAPSSAGFTTHLMDTAQETAWFAAYSPAFQIEFGYTWRRADFPWLGIWEENFSRTHAPWNGRTLTRGMEFGASPFPETRREMIDRGSLFGVPGYRWLPAKSRAEVEYRAEFRAAAPE